MSDLPNTKEKYGSMYADKSDLLRGQGERDSNHSTCSLPTEVSISSNKRTADELLDDNGHFNIKRQKMEENNDLVVNNLELKSEPADMSEIEREGNKSDNDCTQSVPLSWESWQVQTHKRLCKKLKRRRQAKQYRKKRYTKSPREKATANITETAVKEFTTKTSQRVLSPIFTKSGTIQVAANAGESMMSTHTVAATAQHLPSSLRDKGQYKGYAKRKRPVRSVDKTQLHLRVAVTTEPQYNLSAEQVRLIKRSIEYRVIETVLSEPSESIPPAFRGRPFFMDGVLAMWCEDENALAWLKQTVESMQSPIPNTALTVIRQSELMKKIKAGLLLHSDITDSAKIQDILRAQNPEYNVMSWSCYSMTVDDTQVPSSDEKVVYLVLGIPENQKPAILARGCRVCYLTGSKYIRFFS